MENFKKFDLNEKTETTASDSTEYPTFRTIAPEDVPPLPEKDAQDILDKNLQESFSDDDKFTHENIPKLKITILKAMREYSSTQRLQARNEAIQEALSLPKRKIPENNWDGVKFKPTHDEYISVKDLEKLLTP